MSDASSHTLLLTVSFLDGRYHGEPEWPPSPARLFQALIAGGAVRSEIDPAIAKVMRWLEGLPRPLIGAPVARGGQRVRSYVPNNDLDAKGGDPQRVASIRTAKWTRPRLFRSGAPLFYAWALPGAEDSDYAARVCELAKGLYQLGRGIDMAWARGEILVGSDFVRFQDQYPGRIHRPTPGMRPTPGSRALIMACPRPGSFDSLVARYQKNLKRLRFDVSSGKTIQVFEQAPKPRFEHVAYDCAAPRALFDLREHGAPSRFAVTAATKTVQLTEALRDAAAARLIEALPEQALEIKRVLIGGRVQGHRPLPPTERVQLIVLPSIGHAHVDRGLRRVLVVAPRSDRLLPADILWAFSGLTFTGPSRAAIVVTRSDDHAMARHYAIGAQAETRVWRTVTPVALPESGGRRRMEPGDGTKPAKGAAERSEEQARAERATVQAMRHVGLQARVERVRVQREPFEAKGSRAEIFAKGTRFAKERLWHAEVVFRESPAGPVVLGDGRFLGLGLMAPVRAVPRALAFEVVSGLLADANPSDVALALRRAVMARVQEAIGSDQALPVFVSGHAEEGEPSAADSSRLAYVFDPTTQRLLLMPISPWASTRGQRWKSRHWPAVIRSVGTFTRLRAGRAGMLRLEATEVHPDVDSLLAPASHWESRTTYVVNRHRKEIGGEAALVADVQASCRAAGIPVPDVVVREVRGVSGLGLSGRVALRFGSAVAGPLLLGKTRYKGGGLFGHAAE